MKTYKLYKHSDGDVDAVKVGFSWPAFFCGPFWMLAKKLWALAFVWVAVSIQVLVIEERLDQRGGSDLIQVVGYVALAAANFTLWFTPAFKGNEWREKNLVKRGYACTGTVQAESPGAALAQPAKPA